MTRGNIHPREGPLVQNDDAWDLYLHSLMEPSGPLPAQRLRQIKQLWECLRRQVTESLALPHAIATEAGEFVMTWDRGQHHFEIEILPDGRYDWFYLDRSSGERVGEEEQPVGTCGSWGGIAASALTPRPPLPTALTTPRERGRTAKGNAGE